MNTKQKDRCVYCGSVAYGKGCKFGPHNTHLHSSDAKKCSYCGSGSFGRGCKLNPTSDLHIHGVQYNSMFKEQIQNFLDNTFLLKELFQKFEKFPCYELGIIDGSGNKIKSPVTEQEINSYSPLTRTILKIKKYLGSKIELLDAQTSLTNHSIPLTESIDHYNKITLYKSKIGDVVNELYKTIDEAKEAGLSIDEIKKLIQA